MIARALLVALLAAAAYTGLGVAVEHRPPAPLWTIDTTESWFAGHATGMAFVLTVSCWWFVLIAFGIVAGVLAVYRREWRERATSSIVTTLVAWQTSDALKNVWQRPRPTHWYVHQEPTFSYSSGHAMFAVVVYFLWSYYFATSGWPYPVRVVLASAAALWGCGVIWSRLALGAHWPTDLIGGVLLGVTMLALASAVRGGHHRARRPAQDASGVPVRP